MENQKVIEFIRKVKELEIEYSLEIVSENPFCGLLVKDTTKKMIYNLDGSENDF